MAAPYYADDQVTLYHGDCREVTAWLEADVLVTDPPYGRAWRQGDTGKGRGWASDNHDGIAGDLSTEVRDVALAMWEACSKRDWGTPFRLAVVFGDLLVSPPKGTRHVLVYDKGVAAGFTGAIGGYRRNVEGIYLVGNHGSGLGGRSAVVPTRTSAGGNLARTTGHPHTKPLDVMGAIITTLPDWSTTIADPFAGSGSTLVAAKQLGRRAIGVEIDERYCEIAAKRLAQDTLFGAVTA